MSILAHPNRAHPQRQNFIIHAMPDNLPPERALTLLARYEALVESSQHPPRHYIEALVAEIVERAQMAHDRRCRCVPA